MTKTEYDNLFLSCNDPIEIIQKARLAIIPIGESEWVALLALPCEDNDDISFYERSVNCSKAKSTIYLAISDPDGLDDE